MYSLHDITSVCPKLEPIGSDEVDYREESMCPQNQSNGQMEHFAVVSHDNNNSVAMTTTHLDQYKKTANVDTSVHEGTTTNDTNPYDMKSIGAMEAQLPGQAYRAGGSAIEMSDGQILNVYTAVPVYENEDHEVYYYSVGSQDKGVNTQAGTDGTYGYPSESYEGITNKQAGASEGFPAYQANTYSRLPSDQLGPKGEVQAYSMVSQEKAPLYQINPYRGTHRALTAYEVGIQPKHSCSCSCHHQTTPATSHIPAFGLRNERPSVIMVPASWNGLISDVTRKVISSINLHQLRCCRACSLTGPLQFSILIINFLEVFFSPNWQIQAVSSNGLFSWLYSPNLTSLFYELRRF